MEDFLVAAGDAALRAAGRRLCSGHWRGAERLPALERNLILVTMDTDFQRVPNLRVRLLPRHP